MSHPRLLLPRRGLIGGLATLGGLALAGCTEENPPTYGNILRIGDDFTYQAQRLLLGHRALVREFDHADITSMPAIGTVDPGNAKEAAFSTDHGETYDRLRKGAFADWRLEVAGLVSRPGAYSLSALKALPPEARSRAIPARKAGRRSRSGRERRSPPCWMPRACCPGRAT